MKVQCSQAHMAAVAACEEPPTAPYSWRPGSCTPTVPAEGREALVISHREEPAAELGINVHPKHLLPSPEQPSRSTAHTSQPESPCPGRGRLRPVAAGA